MPWTDVRSNATIFIGLLGSWGSTVTSFFLDLGLNVLDSEVSIITVLSGFVSSLFTLAVAHFKYREGKHLQAETELKLQEARAAKIINDKAELEVKLLSLQMEDVKK